MRGQRKLCFIITWRNLQYNRPVGACEHSAIISTKRWCCAYRDQDECWERRSSQRTWRSPRQGRTHTSPRALCRLFCAVEEKNTFLYHTSGGICVEWRFKDSASFIIEITSTQCSQRNLSEVKQESLPSFAVPECFVPSSCPLERFVCQIQQHYNLILISFLINKHLVTD